jgi:chromate transporter
VPNEKPMAEAVAARGSVAEVLAAFLRLGCTSFGGPVAHLGYYRAELVQRRRWLDEATYADIVALCQFLPGPASSQTAMSIGMLRAGLPGGLAAWAGFTLPSAVAMVAFAYGVSLVGDVAHAAWLHGLKIVAVAVVAQAVWGMGRALCPDRLRASMAVGGAIVALAVPSSVGQIGAIVAGGAIGWLALPAAPMPAGGTLHFGVRRPAAVAALVVFFILLAGLPVLAAASGNHALMLLDRFYRAGALVFGGGHVVLPLLQQAVVPPGWIAPDAFLAGYGAAQAVPGPLFTFAAYLGAAMGPAPAGVAGATLCLLAIYLPSALLLVGVLPFWDGLRRRAGVQSALRGVNAAVVGVLLAALYSPVWTSAITGPADFGLGLAAFLALAFWKLPPWLVVVLGGAVAAVLGPIV